MKLKIKIVKFHLTKPFRYDIMSNVVNNVWRSRLVGRGRTTGNRVTVKSGSRVRISPSPPKQSTPKGVLFALAFEESRKGQERSESKSPVDSCGARVRVGAW